ncbi:MAG: hypothetical protein C4542_09750 [Dehalococcoidia bacterium]|nr:MAG: hypothetical protein C4542_09750 [Dehalococcoidia bacterium]
MPRRLLRKEINVYLPAARYEAFRAHCQQIGVPMSELVNRLIERELIAARLGAADTRPIDSSPC